MYSGVLPLNQIHSIFFMMLSFRKIFAVFRNRPMGNRFWIFNAQYLKIDHVRNYKTYLGGVVVFVMDWYRVVDLMALKIVLVLVTLPNSKRC